MPTYKYGAVLPYSSNLDLYGNPTLSVFTKTALEYALQSYKRGLFEKFLLCGEATFGEKSTPASVLMARFLLERGVIKNDIILLPNQNHTASQIRALAEWQRKEREGKIWVGAFLFHYERVSIYAHHMRLNADIYTIDWQTSAPLKKGLDEFEKGEEFLRLLAKIDQGGIIPSVLSILVGPRVTDVDADGRFVNDLARITKLKYWIRNLSHE